MSAWIFPSVVIDGVTEEEAKAVYSRAMEQLTLNICTDLNNDEITVQWDEGCEKWDVVDAEVVDAVSICPACGDPMDYCQGHGEIGDPDGRAILDAHDRGDHRTCAIGADCD